jgi:1-aminocyclopropane-1-carboxylate deaminase/D-cysteine desulfhydrase-like pyridoxal-dependent ACC family enzyme
VSAGRLDAFPRLRLAELPSPFEHLPAMSAELGRDVFAKRDDLIGGNKVRSLEYLMAHAQRRAATRVATFGALESNHVRLTAETARRLGIEAHAVYFERRPSRLDGNALRTAQAGARLHFVPFGRSSHPLLTIEQAIRLARAVSWGLAGPQEFVPVGGFSLRGCLGYARAAVELDEQARASGVGDAWVVLAAGTGGTLAGVLPGLALCGSRLRPVGIDVGNLWRRFPDSIARMVTEVGRRVGSPSGPADAREIPLVERRYVGSGYGLPSGPAAAAARRLEAAEGIRLDAVYTAKAFAGLLDLAKRGALGERDPVVFLHTGGVG